jgi:NAD(P)-dependent dehydrogenase (short-subunit alcohol dehydrogenase family)
MMRKHLSAIERFSLKGKIAVITGGGGMLGRMHAEAIAEAGGIPVLLDIRGLAAEEAAAEIKHHYRIPALGLEVDITRKDSVVEAAAVIEKKVGVPDILINNAANDPKVSSAPQKTHWTRFEQFPIHLWEQDIAVGLTGAFLCAQVFGTRMAERKRGVILNISSDLGLVAPDQRLYRKKGAPPQAQPAKPVSYSIVKTGIIGLTRYLSTYWAEQGVRINALCPGGVEAGQDAEFLKQVSFRIPMGRLARKDEYKSAILFLVSDASSYMTGSTLVIDGGRTAW